MSETQYEKSGYYYPNLIAKIYDVASRWFRKHQVGFAQGYAMVMIFGAAILLAVFYLFKLN